MFADVALKGDNIVTAHPNQKLRRAMLGQIYFVLCLLNIVSGLFLDQMMTDCHGLPFACMLKQQKSGQSQTLYNNLRQKTESNTLTSTLFKQQQSIDSNGGYNPSNMAAIVKQNTESNSGNIGMTMGNSELLSFMNTGSTGQANSMNGQGGSSQGRISNTNMQNGGTPLFVNMLGGSSNGQKSISISKQGNGKATMFSGGGASNSMNSMTNPFSKSMTNLIGNGGLQGSMQNGREPENVKGSVNQVQASVKDNQDNLKNILLQVVGNTCGLDWLNCAKDCFSVDKVTGCPSCSCKRPHSSNSKGSQHQLGQRKCSPLPPNCPKSCVIFDDNGCTVCSCEATPCPPFPDDCPRGFSKIDENRCPICTLDEIASLSKDASMSSTNQKDGSSAQESSWYDRMWSSSK